jgi:hypothetical protein
MTKPNAPFLDACLDEHSEHWPIPAPKQSVRRSFTGVACLANHPVQRVGVILHEVIAFRGNA